MNEGKKKKEEEKCSILVDLDVVAVDQEARQFDCGRQNIECFTHRHPLGDRVQHLVAGFGLHSKIDFQLHNPRSHMV